MKSICIKATGFRRIIVALLAIMICIMPYAVSSADGTPAFVDDAGLCSEDEVQEINTRLDGLCDKYNMKFAIVTVDDMGYKSPMVFSDDYYDEHFINEYPDGVVFMVCMGTRDMYLSTAGYGITAFTDAGISALNDRVAEYLSAGDYYEAFDEFVSLADDYVTKALEGNPYDVDNLPKEPFDFFGSLIIALVVGLLFGIVYVCNLKSKLKSVGYSKSATSYVAPGSFKLADSRDIYLYSTVSKTARPKDTGSSSGYRGGSSTHRSSSGHSHGGGGRKF